MLVSIIAVIKDPKDVTVSVNSFMKMIDGMEYSKCQTEIMFIVLSSPNEGMRSIRTAPMIRVVQLKGDSIGDALSYGIKECYGDYIVLSELGSKFSKFRVLSFGQLFKNTPNLSMIIDKDSRSIALRKLKIKFPADLHDLKTYLILYSLINKYQIIGPWGKLSRSEVLRFAYKMNKILFWHKVKILFKFNLGGA